MAWELVKDSDIGNTTPHGPELPHPSLAPEGPKPPKPPDPPGFKYIWK
jgi:hypothetical protein